MNVNSCLLVKCFQCDAAVGGTVCIGALQIIVSNVIISFVIITGGVVTSLITDWKISSAWPP